MTLGELKAETVQHELVLVGHDRVCPRLGRCEGDKLAVRMHGNVLIDGATSGKRGSRRERVGGDGRWDVRELTAFFNLALEVPFLIQQVLETQVRLVHLVARVGGRLLVCACGGVGRAVERLEACKEGAGADMDGGLVIGSDAGVGEVAEVVEDMVGGGRGWPVHEKDGVTRAGPLLPVDGLLWQPDSRLAL